MAASDERDFTDLLVPLVQPAYRLACAMLHDSDAAKDVVQEASLIAWRKLSRLRDRDRASAWFLTIVANECRNVRRHKWVTGVTVGLPFRVHQPSDEDRAVTSADLRSALMRLGHRDRLVVSLYFYLDLPIAEIAQIAGCSAGAARVRASQICSSLASRSGDRGGAPMSLRTDIRAAIDEVSSPTPDLSRDVVAYLFPRQATKTGFRFRFDRTWRRRVRGMTAIAAALLVLALMASLVVGGRVWRELNTLSTPSMNQSELKRLEARPLTLPLVAADAVCPEGPTSGAAGDQHGGPPVTFGNGPLYADKGGHSFTKWGTWVGQNYCVDLNYSGPALIRARDLRTGDVVAFKSGLPSAIALVSSTPAGEVVGQDIDNLSQRAVTLYSEVTFEAAGAPDLPYHFRQSFANAGFPKGGSGCIGYQIDGSNFTEIFVIDEGA